MLRAFEGIEDVAVLGTPDEHHGELVTALVVPESGNRFNRRAFDEFARAPGVHMRPRVVDVVPVPLPRNPLGKLLRRALRARNENGNGKPTANPR